MAVFEATGETQEAAEHARYGVIRLLYNILIPVKRTPPHLLEPFFEDGRMVAFHTAWEADAWLKRRIEEARDAE